MNVLTRKLGCVYFFRFIIVFSFCLLASSHSSFADDDDGVVSLGNGDDRQRFTIYPWLPLRNMVNVLEDLRSVMRKDWKPHLLEILSTVDEGSMDSLSFEDKEALKVLGDRFLNDDWVPDTRSLHQIALAQSYGKIETPLKAVLSLLIDDFNQDWSSLNLIKTTERDSLIHSLDIILEAGVYFSAAFTRNIENRDLADGDSSIEFKVWELVDKSFEEFYFQDNHAALSEWFNKILWENLVLLLQASNVKDLKENKQLVDWRILNRAYVTDRFLNAYFSSYESSLRRLKDEYNDCSKSLKLEREACRKAFEQYKAFSDKSDLLRVQWVQSLQGVEALLFTLEGLEALCNKNWVCFKYQYDAYKAALKPYEESLALLGGMEFGGDLENIGQQILVPWLALENVLLNRLDFVLEALNNGLRIATFPEVVAERLPSEVFLVEQGRAAIDVNKLYRKAVLQNALKYQVIWPLPEALDLGGLEPAALDLGGLEPEALDLGGLEPEASFEQPMHSPLPLWGGGGSLG